MTPEGAVVAAILEYLQLRGIFAWRMNTGATVIKVPNGKDRFLRFGKKGISDIIGILDDGRWLAIECKTEKGKASLDQLYFLAEIAKRGGVAFVARSIEDVVRELDKAKRRIA